jgi:hypothetical protein
MADDKPRDQGHLHLKRQEQERVGAPPKSPPEQERDAFMAKLSAAASSAWANSERARGRGDQSVGCGPW